jgi:hypothetical protein
VSLRLTFRMATSPSFQDGGTIKALWANMRRSIAGEQHMLISVSYLDELERAFAIIHHRLWHDGHLTWVLSSCYSRVGAHGSKALRFVRSLISLNGGGQIEAACNLYSTCRLFSILVLRSRYSGRGPDRRGPSVQNHARVICI